MAMSIAELAYLKLFNEKINPNTQKYLKLFHISKKRTYFTKKELHAVFGGTKNKNHNKIISTLKKNGIIEQEGQIYKIQPIEKILC